MSPFTSALPLRKNSFAEPGSRSIRGAIGPSAQNTSKPSRAQRDAWVTILAEADKGKDDLSPLALRMVEQIRRRLDQEGYDFELNLDETGGVAYAEVHFRTLTKKDTPNATR